MNAPKVGNNPTSPLYSISKKEIFLVATAVALAILGTLAYLGVGAFAHMGPNTAYFAFVAWSGAGVAILLELALRIVNHRKNGDSSIVYSKHKLNEDNPNLYSRHGLPATKKLAKQTLKAIEEGPRNQTYPDDYRRYKSITTPTISTDTPAHVGISHNKGRRTNDEDAYLYTAINWGNIPVEITGIFDGHGDKQKAANYVAAQLAEVFIKKLGNPTQTITDELVTNAITQAMFELNKGYIPECGGTCVTCAIKIGSDIYFANVGDSRSILVKPSSEYQLTEDADPSNERFARAVDRLDERSEDKKKQCPAIHNFYGVPRVLSLALTRSIGDHNIKIFGNGNELITPRPKITKISAGTEADVPTEGKIYYQTGNYLVIACDGLWDVFTTKDIAAKIRDFEKFEFNPTKMSTLLVNAALEEGSTDNVSVAVIKLP